MSRNISIIMSAPMVLALLAGRKTMTRRLAYQRRKVRNPAIGESAVEMARSPWQRVEPGDRLWVREGIEKDGRIWRYRSDRKLVELAGHHPRVYEMVAWARHQERNVTTSLHMPRWASRLTLIVTATKIERLTEISEDDAVAEGITEDDGSETEIWYVPGAAKAGWKIEMAERPSTVFRSLWIALHGQGSWDANPEVVAVSFRVEQQNIDEVAA